MSNSEFIFGIHAIQSVLEEKPGDIKEVWTSAPVKNKRILNILKTVKAHKIPIKNTSRENIDKKIGKSNHQNILALTKKITVFNEDKLYELAENKKEKLFLLVIDGVTDTHNFGACIRTAEGAGVNAIITQKRGSAEITPAVRKIASGAAERMTFFQVTNLARTFELLKKQGIWLYGTAEAAELTLYEVNFSFPLAIIVGSEDTGLKNLLIKKCDHMIRCPMSGKTESLNVSVATGIVLFEAKRQLKDN
jgi:23S rRNA (guanosine2251-2'-O)-methyltransferase